MSRKTMTPRAASNSSMGAPGLVRISASLSTDLDAAFFRCCALRCVGADRLRPDAYPKLPPGMIRAHTDGRADGNFGLNRAP